MKTLMKNCDIVASSPSGFYVLKNAFCGIEDDTICCLGETQPTEKYDYVKDMGGKVLFPGLINTHCHAAMTLLRGIGSDLPLQEWLFDHMFPTEDKLRPQDVKAGSQLAIMEMLSTGTVSFSDMYYFCEDTAEAVLESGIKANICRAISAFDPNEAYEDSYRVKEALKLYDAYHNAGNGRLKIDLSLHAEYTCLEHIV
ncbi:MAG: amidohydrolase family protein, partial [Clostridia bacterium]|nr:amidohydrolase family protein [Clostridia bacterium]